MRKLVQHKRQHGTVEGAFGEGQCFRASDLPLDRTLLGKRQLMGVAIRRRELLIGRGGWYWRYS